MTTPPPLPPVAGGPSTNKTPPKATWAFILSLFGFVCAIPAVVGLILGIVSLPETKHQQRGQGLAVAAIVIGGAWLLIFLMVGVVSAVSGGNNENASPPSTSQSASPTSESSESSSPADESSSASPEPTESESVEPTPTPTPTIEPITYEGSGTKILKIKKPESGAVLITMTHEGSSNFAVWSLDGNLEQMDLLANTIGNYSGTTVLDVNDGEETERLDISADGNWTVTISPLASAKRFTGSAEGTSDDVLIYEGPVGVATLTHKGDSNFAVWFYSTSSSDLAANEIGNYSGEAVIPEGPTLVEVETEGKWTIRVE